MSELKGCPIQHLSHENLEADNHDLQRFGQATIARLALDKVVRTAFERVLFIDADVYIADDLMPLFQMNMNGQSMVRWQIYLSMDLNTRVGDQFRSECLKERTILWPA